MDDFEPIITHTKDEDENSDSDTPPERQREVSVQTTAVDASVSLDRVLSVLSHHDRRQALYYLHKCEDDIPLSDLVRHVVARQTSANLLSETDEAFEQTYQSFRETHLQKLAVVGLIDYDVEEDWVTLSENTDIVSNEFPDMLLQLTASAEQTDETAITGDSANE